MMDLRPMIEELVTGGADDWVMAAEIAWVAKSVGGAGDDESIRELSMRLIRRVIEEGLMEIGEVCDGGFFEWGLPIGEAVERADRAWRDLDRAPNLGDVCWLENTEKGALLAEQVFERRRHGGER